MDKEGDVQLVDVEPIEGEFNEGLTMSPFAPSTKLLDLYGAQDMESLGQGLVPGECQSELYLVGLKNPTNGKASSIWLKHYKKGILTVEEDDDDEDDFPVK